MSTVAPPVASAMWAGCVCDATPKKPILSVPTLKMFPPSLFSTTKMSLVWVEWAGDAEWEDLTNQDKLDILYRHFTSVGLALAREYVIQEAKDAAMVEASELFELENELGEL